jgi:hypothetical protein
MGNNDTTGKKVYDMTGVDPVDAIRALTYICNHILLHLCYPSMNADGESGPLTVLLGDVGRQDSHLTPGAQKWAMGMIAAVEETLREIAKKEKRRAGDV